MENKAQVGEIILNRDYEGNISIRDEYESVDILWAELKGVIKVLERFQKKNDEEGIGQSRRF
jgi:hypothetical protein